MTAASKASLDVFKDIPGYKAILKAVLKNQIQMLVEQLSDQTGEETVLLTASVSDGTLSHLGSEFGQFFLEDHDEIKSQFLGYCLKGHHKRKVQETLDVPQAKKRFADEARHSPSNLSTYSSESDMVYSPSQTFTSSTTHSIRPIALTKAKQKSKQHSNFKQDKREFLKGHAVLQSEREFGHQVESGIDMSGGTSDNTDVLDPSLQGTDPMNFKTEPEVSREDDPNVEEEQSADKTTEVMTDALEMDKYTNSAAAHIKVELSEEDELEITGIEHGDASNQSSDFGQGSSDSQLYMQNVGGMTMVAQNTSMDSPKFDVYGQNIRLSGTRGGYPMYSPDPSADCEGLIVTRGGSRVEKMIKCDLCGKVYRTSNMARHKKRYCKAVIRNTGNGVEDSTNAILNNP